MTQRILIVGREASCHELAAQVRRAGLEAVTLVDPAGTEAIQELFLTVGASGLIAASEDAYTAVAEAAAVLGKPGPSLEWLKPGSAGALLKCLTARGVPVVPYRAVSEVGDAAAAAHELGAPIWVVSGTLVGSAWCVAVDHLEDLPMALAKAKKRSAASHILLERAVFGSHYRVLGFKVHRNFLPIEIFAEEWLAGPYCVPTAYTLPCSLGGAAYKKAIEIAEQAAACLPTGYGLIEIGLIADGDALLVQGLSVLRCVTPVDAKMLELAYGIDLHADIIRLLSGAAPQAAPRRELCAAVRWLTASTGLLEEVQGVEEAAKAGPFVEVHVAAQVGDVIGHVTDRASRDAVGYVLAAAPLRQQALDTLKSATGAIHFNTRAALD